MRQDSGRASLVQCNKATTATFPIDYMDSGASLRLPFEGR